MTARRPAPRRNARPASRREVIWKDQAKLDAAARENDAACVESLRAALPEIAEIARNCALSLNAK